MKLLSILIKNPYGYDGLNQVIGFTGSWERLIPERLGLRLVSLPYDFPDDDLTVLVNEKILLETVQELRLEKLDL